MQNMIYKWTAKLLDISNGLVVIGNCNEKCKSLTQDGRSFTSTDHAKFCAFWQSALIEIAQKHFDDDEKQNPTISLSAFFWEHQMQ